MDHLRMNLFVLVAVGTITYFAVIYLLRVIDREDIQILAEVLKKT